MGAPILPGWLQVRRGDERVCQDLLPGHAADDARAGQGHLGHLRVVQVSRAALKARCSWRVLPARLLDLHGQRARLAPAAPMWGLGFCALFQASARVILDCRRTDELVDGPNASRITPAVSTCPPHRCARVAAEVGRPPCTATLPSPSWRLQALDRWENRLEALFEGRPYDALDAALTDTVSRFPVHIQPFRYAVVVLAALLPAGATYTAPATAT